MRKRKRENPLNVFIWQQKIGLEMVLCINSKIKYNEIEAWIEFL